MNAPTIKDIYDNVYVTNVDYDEKYFTHVELIYFTKGHRFFIFRCKNEKK